MNDRSASDGQRTNDWVEQAIRSPKRNTLKNIAKTVALIPPLTVLNTSVYRDILHAVRVGERGEVGQRGVHRGNMRFSKSGNQLDLFKNILRAENTLLLDKNVEKLVTGWAKGTGKYKIWIDCHEGAETRVDLPKTKTRFGREHDADNDIKLRLGKSDPQAIKAALLMADELTQEKILPNRLVVSNWLVGESRSAGLKGALSEVTISSDEDSGTHTISKGPPPSNEESEESQRRFDRNLLEKANGTTRPYAGTRSRFRGDEGPRSR